MNEKSSAPWRHKTPFPGERQGALPQLTAPQGPDALWARVRHDEQVLARTVPQMVDDVVEVLTTASLDVLQQYLIQQIDDTPVPGASSFLGSGMFTAGFPGDDAPLVASVRGSGMWKAGSAGDDAPLGPVGMCRAGFPGDGAPLDISVRCPSRSCWHVQGRFCW